MKTTLDLIFLISSKLSISIDTHITWKLRETFSYPVSLNLLANLNLNLKKLKEIKTYILYLNKRRTLYNNHNLK